MKDLVPLLVYGLIVVVIIPAGLELLLRGTEETPIAVAVANMAVTAVLGLAFLWAVWPMLPGTAEWRRRRRFDRMLKRVEAANARGDHWEAASILFEMDQREEFQDVTRRTG